MDVRARDRKWSGQGGTPGLGIAPDRSLGGVPGGPDDDYQARTFTSFVQEVMHQPVGAGNPG
jgi:hypothetical protein